MAARWERAATAALLVCLAGAAQAKRQIAAKYGVNPYSTNPELQDELNKIAWVQAGVGGAVNVEDVDRF